MFRLLCLLCILSHVNSRVFHLDRLTYETNPVVGNATLAYTHNEEGAAVTNITMQTFGTITKALMYIRVRVPDHTGDREFRREWIRTVVDIEKIIKGLQQNPFIKNLAKELLKTMDFELKMPLKAGTYRIVNATLDSKVIIPLIKDTKFALECKVVGKIVGSSSSVYFGRVEFFGDRYTIETNPVVGNATLAYIHDEAGAAVVNVIMQTFKTITKELVYVRGCIPEDKNDREFKREWLRTIVDIEKVMKGMQNNMFLRDIATELLKNLDFEFKMPLRAGTYRMINATLSAKLLPIFQDTKIFLELRVVGKVAGSKSSVFFGRAAFYGGLRA